MFALSGETIGVIAGVLVSLAGTVGLSAKFRGLKPVRWLLTQLVIEPVSEAFDRHLDDRVADAVADAVTEAVEPIREHLDGLGIILRSIHYEMHPNSGASMRDVVDRTEGTTVYMAGEVDAIRDEVDHLKNRTARLEGAVDVLRDRG